MTVAAPPQAPHVWETEGEDLRDALIREARRRARRRRCAYGVTAFLIAIAAGAFVGRGEGAAPPPSNAAGNNPTATRASDSPLVRGPDAASTLLASWGQMHSGYVLVYGDGRALWYPDWGVLVDAQRRMFTLPWHISRHADGPVFVDADGRFIGPADGHTFEGARREFPVLERHLSPAGLDLVRTRRLDLHRLAVGLFNSRDELWVEPTARPYEPSKYAICDADALSEGLSRTAADLVERLPDAARVLLAGKRHIYDPNIGVRHWWPEPLPLMDCFELTTGETAALYEVLDAGGFIDHGPPGMLDWFARAGGDDLLLAMPVYPHGQPVIFGG